MAFLRDVDEQEVEHELELVHVEQLRVNINRDIAGHLPPLVAGYPSPN